MNAAIEHTVRTYIDRAAAGGKVDRVFAELASFTRMLASSRRLAKVLADPDVPNDAKRNVISDVATGRFDPITVELLAAIATEQRVETGTVTVAFADVCAEVAFAAAEAAGQLLSLESTLYEFAQVLRQNTELRQAINNPGVDDGPKQQLVADLLAGKADARAVTLLQILISLRNGQDVDGAALRWSTRAAARRNMVIADIRTAIEIDDHRKQQLTEVLGRSVGSTVQGRFSVDPSIVGSVIVRIGDEVFDGSVRHRLEQARNAVAG